MDVVNVGDRAGGSGGSSDGETVGKLVGMFIMDMELFDWLVVGARDSVGKESVGWSYWEDLVGGNGVNRRGAVGAIAVREALYILQKSLSPLEVTRFDWVTWRVGAETLIETCSTRWRLYDADSLVDIMGISAL